MKPFRIVLVAVLGLLVMGQTSGDCTLEPPAGSQERQLTEGSYRWYFPNGAARSSIRLAGNHPYLFKADPRTRVELWRKSPERWTWSGTWPNPLDDLGLLANDTLGSREQQNYVYTASSEDVGTWVDLKAENPLYGGIDPFTGLPWGIEWVTLYDEGAASLLLPWDTDDNPIDPAYPPLVANPIANALGGGLNEVIVDGIDAGLQEADGMLVRGLDEFWFSNAISKINFDTGRRTELVHEWSHDSATSTPVHELVARTYFHSDGSLEWNFEGAGEWFAYYLGAGWLLDVLQIGDCPDRRLTSVTIRGHFRITFTGDTPVFPWEVPPGEEWEFYPFLHPNPPGLLSFRVTDVAVKINPYPAIRIGCNNRRGTVENRIAAYVLETVGDNIDGLSAPLTDTLATALGHTPEFERVEVTAEGLLLIIAEDENDPDYTGAASLGLASEEPRPATSFPLYNIADRGTPQL